MAYTVKEIAKMAGISVRTVHWYDEKGLLKPAYYGATGYRYYEKEQLLILQQILFFKELGFCLKDIQKLLLQADFNKVKALTAHKQILIEDIKRKNDLIVTIDKTISKLRGKSTMSDKELYYGFDSQRQKGYEAYLVKYQGKEEEKLFNESKKRTAPWDKKDWEGVKKISDAIYKKLADAVESELTPAPTKEVYIGLTELYDQHPDFRKFFDSYHPNLVDYIGQAMKYYAEKNL